MNRRRALASLGGLAAAGLPHFAAAQAQRRIGVLLTTTKCPPPAELVKSLAALGWVEGRTVVFDCVSALNRLDKLPSLAAELVARRPDIIVSSLLPAIRALTSTTATIPIVALGVADPVGQKLVQSLGRPGGNLTGLVSVMLELEEKRIEFLKEILPNLSRLAAVYRRGGDPGYYEAIDRILEHLDGIYRIRHERFYYQRNEDIAGVLDEIASKRFDAVYFPPGPLTETAPALVATTALARRIPAVGQGSPFAEAGALMTYSPDRTHVAERSAAYVDRILRGAKPGDLPFEQPTKFELVVNRKTANALGVAIPQAILLRADRVIE